MSGWVYACAYLAQFLVLSAIAFLWGWRVFLLYEIRREELGTGEVETELPAPAQVVQDRSVLLPEVALMPAPVPRTSSRRVELMDCIKRSEQSEASRPAPRIIVHDGHFESRAVSVMNKYAISRGVARYLVVDRQLTDEQLEAKFRRGRS